MASLASWTKLQSLMSLWVSRVEHRINIVTKNASHSRNHRSVQRLSSSSSHAQRMFFSNACWKEARHQEERMTISSRSRNASVGFIS